MARYDAARVAGTAEPLTDGTSGVEPTCDAYGRLVTISFGGGGGGDASAAHQLTQIAKAEDTITALGALLSETTGLDIVIATQEVRDGIVALGNGATVFDLFQQLSDLNSAAASDALTQAGIASDVQLSTLAVQAIEMNTQDIEDAMVDGTQRARLTDGTNNVAVTNTDPAAGDYGLVVRQVPSLPPGKQIHAQTSISVANAANKLLFGFTNNTGATLYLLRANAINTQSATIAGVICQLNLQLSSGAITLGTTITTGTIPALVASTRNPATHAVPAGITWNTNGTMGGTVYVVESIRPWSTDELSANGSGMAHEIAANALVHDLIDLQDDPLVIPNGWSCAIVADSAATNGQTLVHFNIGQS